MQAIYIPEDAGAYSAELRDGERIIASCQAGDRDTVEAMISGARAWLEGDDFGG